MRVVLDSNILIDYLRGHEQAATEMARYTDARISIVTWMEVLVGARDDDEEIRIREYLSSFTLVDLTSSVALAAVEIRRVHGIKLPDAIVWASARDLGCLLVTRNAHDFPVDEPDVRIPYVLEA